MASEANVCARIQRLIDRGLIYYGQPTSLLRERLERESRSWYTVWCGETTAWGQRANESVCEMVWLAQWLLYGIGGLSAEEYRDIERRHPGLCTALRELCGHFRRHSHSPPALSVLRYHVARRDAGILELPSVSRTTLDSVELWTRGVSARDCESLARWLAWLETRHRVVIHIDTVAASYSLAGRDSDLAQRIILGFALTADIDAAQEFAHSHTSASTALDHVLAAMAILHHV